MELTNQKYRVSEVGIIPVEWEVMHLGDIANVIGGGTPSTFNDDYWNGDINWFTPTEIGLKKYSYESIRKITKEGLENSSARVLPIGTILLTSRAGIGDVSILMNEACTNQGFQSLVAKGELNNEFLYYVVTTLKKVLLQNASGSTFLEISPKKVKSIQVAIPSTLKEQTAIATALSDTDALIENLEKLIAKKQNIKQGVMQELLKPKKNFAVKKFGEIFDFKQGVQCPVEKQFYTESPGLKRFIRIIDLTQPEEMPRFISDPGSSHHVEKNDLFMVRYGTPGLLGFGYEGVIANNLFRLIPKKRINTHYFYYLLFYNNSDISKISSSTTMAAINFTALKELELSYPSDISTQIQIANIFSEMDNEIESMAKKLRKYKMIKLGMMQVLLTGKIRLS